MSSLCDGGDPQDDCRQSNASTASLLWASIGYLIQYSAPRNTVWTAFAARRDLRRCADATRIGKSSREGRPLAAETGHLLERVGDLQDTEIVPVTPHDLANGGTWLTVQIVNSYVSSNSRVRSMSSACRIMALAMESPVRRRQAVDREGFLRGRPNCPARPNRTYTEPES